MISLNRTQIAATGFAVISVGLAGPMVQPALAANLGAANDYNIFVFEDYVQTPRSSDVQGRLAVGGNAIAPGGVNLNLNLPSSSQLLGLHPSALVVGKDLALRAEVNGDALVGGKVFPASNRSGTGTIKGALISGGNVNGVNVAGVATTGDPDVANDISRFFADSYSYLTNLSQSLRGLAATGTVQRNGSTLALDASGTDTNVFNLMGAQLKGLSDLTIGAPSGSTVVVNVDGSFALQNQGMSLSGISRENVLFNVFNASSINLAGISFQGSLMAPDTDFVGNNGNFEGTIIANSFTGTLEGHNYQFAGELPEPGASVPTPALLPGLLGFGAALRKRLHQPQKQAAA